ncbi:hypothetical protein TIFTF001_016961 [Ficus carica]|uniref:Uncharacterized protein n=1 Tax=Ficus carica TaxID=3494 RepID=A0AA88ABB2_FICCA|nr:hypothetical protein TIFTF001_016961 [Ficus carica]
MMVWSIWKARNSWVSDHNSSPPLQVVENAGRFLGLFQKCCEVDSGHDKLEEWLATSLPSWLNVLALREGLEFARSCNLRIDWVESDSCNIIRAVLDDHFEGTEGVVI